MWLSRCGVLVDADLLLLLVAGLLLVVEADLLRLVARPRVVRVPGAVRRLVEGPRLLSLLVAVLASVVAIELLLPAGDLTAGLQQLVLHQGHVPATALTRLPRAEARRLLGAEVAARLRRPAFDRGAVPGGLAVGVGRGLEASSGGHVASLAAAHQLPAHQQRLEAGVVAGVSVVLVALSLRLLRLLRFRH